MGTTRKPTRHPKISQKGVAKKRTENIVGRVADLRHISIKEATEYFRKVQALCRADPRLRGQNFMDYLIRYRSLNLSPERLVAIMYLQSVDEPKRHQRKSTRRSWDAKRIEKRKGRFKKKGPRKPSPREKKR